MFLFDMWEQLADEAPKETVVCEGAYNVHTSPIGQYRVNLTYGDLTLIVAMIEDYVRGLEATHSNDMALQYHIDKFKHISEKIQKQIEYDYEKKKEKCAKKKKDDDIGEDAMILALKKSMREAEAKEAVKDDASKQS